MTKPTSQRGQQVYRIELYDRITGGNFGWIDRGPPDANGQPSQPFRQARPAHPMWTATEAKQIAAAYNKPMGTVSRVKARVVKDAKATQELSLRCPTGEAA